MANNRPYEPSSIFLADQGLPNDTIIDLDDTTEHMTQFIALIVGDPIDLWDLYDEYVKRPSRRFYARVWIGDVLFDDDHIISIELDDTVNPTDSITLGSVASAKLNVSLYDKDNVKYNDKKVIVEIGLDMEGDVAYAKLGESTVDEVICTKDLVEDTCFYTSL